MGPGVSNATLKVAFREGADSPPPPEQAMLVKANTAKSPV